MLPVESCYGIEGISINSHSDLFWYRVTIMEAQSWRMPYEAAPNNVNPGEGVPIGLDEVGIWVSESYPKALERRHSHGEESAGEWKNK